MLCHSMYDYEGVSRLSSICHHLLVVPLCHRICKMGRPDAFEGSGGFAQTPSIHDYHGSRTHPTLELELQASTMTAERNALNLRLGSSHFLIFRSSGRWFEAVLFRFLLFNIHVTSNARVRRSTRHEMRECYDLLTVVLKRHGQMLMFRSSLGPEYAWQVQRKGRTLRISTSSLVPEIDRVPLTTGAT